MTSLMANHYKSCLYNTVDLREFFTLNISSITFLIEKNIIYEV